MMKNVPFAFIEPETLELIEQMHASVQKTNMEKKQKSKPVTLAARLKAGLENAVDVALSRFYYDGPESLANFERAMRGTRGLAK